MRLDCLSMRRCLTVGAFFKAASFGTGIPGEGRVSGEEMSEFVLSLCPHSPSKLFSLSFTIGAVSFPTLLLRNLLGK